MYISVLEFGIDLILLYMSIRLLFSGISEYSNMKYSKYRDSIDRVFYIAIICISVAAILLLANDMLSIISDFIRSIVL